MKACIYSTMESIKVANWYNGEVSALYAFSNGCTISKKDANKVRYHLKKIGVNVSILDGVIVSINY